MWPNTIGNWLIRIATESVMNLWDQYINYLEIYSNPKAEVKADYSIQFNHYIWWKPLINSWN